MAVTVGVTVGVFVGVGEGVGVDVGELAHIGGQTAPRANAIHTLWVPSETLM